MEQLIKDLALKAKKASYAVAGANTEQKNRALLLMADELENKKQELQAENEKDLENGKSAGLSTAMLDRLRLTDKVISQMSQGLREIAALPDPVGELSDMISRPSGIQVGRMRIPLGLVAIIYESRPNVTADAAALCLKSGNATLLRGGSEAIHSNKAIAAILQDSLEKVGLPKEAVTVLEVTDREAIRHMLKLDEIIDIVIPRGGEGLIRFVAENSRIPVIKHYKGTCHVYVDAAADPNMAIKIIINAKTQRTGVCNAAETMLVHQNIADEFLPLAYKALVDKGVEIRGCVNTLKVLLDVKEATEEDWPAEYLDLILAVKVVSNLDEAIEHIRKYGSLHTETIVTNDHSAAMRFIREVDSSSVMINASTRFADGFEYGLGAEIGISTSKLHAYGPMGLRELTAQKFVVFGNGNIRE